MFGTGAKRMPGRGITTNKISVCSLVMCVLIVKRFGWVGVPVACSTWWCVDHFLCVVCVGVAHF